VGQSIGGSDRKKPNHPQGRAAAASAGTAAGLPEWLAEPEYCLFEAEEKAAWTYYATKYHKAGILEPRDTTWLEMLCHAAGMYLRTARELRTADREDVKAILRPILADDRQFFRELREDFQRWYRIEAAKVVRGPWIQ
jgi:hypothetical protein